MSDDDNFYWSFYKFRWLLAFGVLFAGLFVYSLFDLVFLALARTGTATVSEVYRLPGRRGADYWMMDFKFKDAAGHERVGKVDLGTSEDRPPVGTEFEIQYLPYWLLDAPDASRPKRPFGWLTLGAFLVVAAGFGFFAYRAIYPPSEHRPVASRRRRT